MQYPKILLTALLVCASFFMVTYTACKKDPCEGITCQNGGACKDGACACPLGYTGTFCETKPDPCKDINCLNGGTCLDGICHCTNGYTGGNCELTFAEGLKATYTCMETCTPFGPSPAWNSTVLQSLTDKTRIVITNFGDYGFDVTALVLKDSIVLDNTAQVSGSGTYSHNVLVIEYTATDGSDSITCTMTMTR